MSERESAIRKLESTDLKTTDQGIGCENEIYTRRFSAKEERTRQLTWEVLCKDFFQRYISTGDTVLDIGAGDGLFLTNIKARRRIAIDLSPHVLRLREFGIEVLQVPATEFVSSLTEQVDVIFMSNFLEHLPQKRLVLEVFAECKRALKPGGMLLILQPNIRYTGVAYWDYIDHHIALTEHSLTEALEVSGYAVVQLIPRFLPYTAKSTIGHIFGGDRTKNFISLYLKLPLLWRFLGAQTFVVATLK